MSFDIANIRKNKPSKGKIFVYWLAGSGFVFKFSSGRIICIDPYLSDEVEKLCGFRRLSLSPISADKLYFDILLLTHEHPDHLDMGSFDVLMRTNPDCKILTPASCVEVLAEESIDFEVISPGMSKVFDDIEIQAVEADHGELSPEAVGYIIRFDGRSLFFTGDTSFNKEVLDKAIKSKPEIIIPCINGAYGNLSAKEAAILARYCSSKIAIPSHFWLFAEHGGCPQEFRENLKTESPDTEVILLTPGRGIEI